MAMRRLLAVCSAALLAVAQVASADGNDAGSGKDADDACTPGVAPTVTVPVGPTVIGELPPVEDTADHFAVHAAAGTVLTITLNPGPGLPKSSLGAPDYELLVLRGTDCGLLAASTQAGNLAEQVQVTAPRGSHLVVAVKHPAQLPLAAAEAAYDRVVVAALGLGIAVDGVPANHCMPMCAYELTVAA